VIWIRRGNCSTDEALALLLSEHEFVLQFGRDPEATFLALG
jgi:predicted nuclease of predicted toxin-antitoxin system